MSKKAKKPTSRGVAIETSGSTQRGSDLERGWHASRRFAVGAISMVALASVVLVIASVVLATQVSRLSKIEKRVGAGDMEQVARLADADPRNRHISLSNPEGSKRLDLVLTKGDLVLLTNARLDETKSGRRYVLWANEVNNAVPVGAFRVDADERVVGRMLAPTGVAKFFVTDEPSAGVTVPSGLPLVVGVVGERSGEEDAQ